MSKGESYSAGIDVLRPQSRENVASKVAAKRTLEICELNHTVFRRRGANRIPIADGYVMGRGLVVALKNVRHNNPTDAAIINTVATKSSAPRERTKDRTDIIAASPSIGWRAPRA